MWFSRKKKVKSLKVDLHSHLIPGIDDGVQDYNESLEILRGLKVLGYEKVITTPHIHPKYPNSSEKILEGLTKLREKMQAQGLSIELEAAAEYYVDETFEAKLERKEPLLFFGDKYVLIETSFINKSLAFENIMFKMKSEGYRPVLAHPERYQYLEGDTEWIFKMREMGVFMQVTLSSFLGRYGEIPKKVAEHLLSWKQIDFLGSDLHRIRQFDVLEKALKLKKIQRAIAHSEVLNDALL